MLAMKTVSETRAERLEELIVLHGSIATLNERIGLDRTDSTLSQIRNASPHNTTGMPRSMGDQMARRIEERLGLERGYMDTPITMPLPDPRTAHLLHIWEAMSGPQRDTTMKIVTAIAEPGDGTNG